VKEKNNGYKIMARPITRTILNKNCLNCESVFETKDNNRKFCSHKCYSVNKIGCKSWNKGQKTPQLTDENHGHWKGVEVSYRNLHRWIERKLGKPNKCVTCGRLGYGRHMHWANISEKYTRDLSDWIRLCASCHKKYDLNKTR
jgi:endogenous inhibitor of DNA gyrase (YacG/DUF329 family)